MLVFLNNDMSVGDISNRLNVAPKLARAIYHRGIEKPFLNYLLATASSRNRYRFSNATQVRAYFLNPSRAPWENPTMDDALVNSILLIGITPEEEVQLSLGYKIMSLADF